MKKHLPNILLFIVVLANIFFMVLYTWNKGLGMFFNTTGIVFLVLGIIIFIFFLSIDPGYGWTKSIDLTKNYIMIFTSMAVCMAGVVLIVTGQHINELQVQATNEKKRCRELVAGNAVNVMKEDWYSLRDQGNRELLSVYLFQKKSNRNNYKIIATLKQTGTTQTLKNLTISSESLPESIAVDRKDLVCTGVFEKNISIDFDKHQKLKEQVQFDLLLTIAGNEVPGATDIEHEKTVQFNLKNKPHEAEEGARSTQQLGKQVQTQTNRFESGLTGLQG